MQAPPRTIIIDSPECHLPPGPEFVDPNPFFPDIGHVTLERKEYTALVIAHTLMKARLEAAEACLRVQQ